MAPAPAARQAENGSARPRPRVVPNSSPARPSIRWDRVGRAGLLFVLVAILGLYIGPSLSYFSAWRESRTRSDEVRRLEHEQKRLKARKAELQSPRIVEQEARRLGMVRPGERAYVVGDLPTGP
jgi:cell division protein FtsB